MFDGMEDADLIKMARGEVPPHMRAQLLQHMQGRIKKYEAGGLVQSDPLSGISTEELKNMIASGAFNRGAIESMKAEVAKREGKLGMQARPELGAETPLMRRSREMASDTAQMEREAGSTAEQPRQRARSPLDIAAETLRKKGITAPEKTNTPNNMKPESVLDRASRQTPADPADATAKRMPSRPVTPTPAPKPPQSRLAQAARAQQPRASAPEPEQAFRLPTMRPEGETEQAPAPKPEQPSTLARAAAEPGKKEPPTWASPLMAAGFAMLASRSPNFGNALGEAGLAFMSQSQQEEAQRRRALREASQDSREDRRLGQTDRQIDQQAELTREQIAARKAAAEENARLRGDEMLMRREDREAQRGLQGARLAMDREMMGLEKQKMQAAIAQMGAKADPTRLIYDAANEIVAKSGGMISGPDAARAAMEMYRTVITGGAPAPGANPLGFGGGALSQGGQTPNPARLLP